MKWKVFELESWSALLSCLSWLKKTADKNTSAVSGLGEDLVKLSQVTAQDVAKKQDKAETGTISFPAEGWAEDETEGYPCYYDLPVKGVTAIDRAEVYLAPASVAAAEKCGLCATCETMKDVIRIRAKGKPSNVLNPQTVFTGEYRLEKEEQEKE